jgi:cytochrome c
MRKAGSVFAVAALAATLAACGQSQTNQSAENGQAASSAQPTPPAAPAMSDDEKKALLASFPAPYNQADLANGETKFGLCRSCHTITPGGANMTGPNLHGVFGQKAASKADYKYSDALKGSGIVWDANHLDQWLEKPQTYLPGTKMTFAGLKDANDRRDLVAYLMVETGHKPS